MNPETDDSVNCALGNRTKADPLNPGVRFGWWGSKEYFMKNMGNIKDYRTARQLLIDAETAMQKTIDIDKSRCRRLLQDLSRERLAALQDGADKSAIIQRLLREKEV